MIKKLLILWSLCVGTIPAWAMEEIKNENGWEVKVQEREKTVRILKVISLFGKDYIEKNKLKLDEDNTDSPIAQWNAKFGAFQKSLVAVNSAYQTWDNTYKTENTRHQYSGFGSNRWVLTYLKLRPYNSLSSDGDAEVNFLMNEDIINQNVDINKDKDSVILKKGVEPFFSFEFIQRTCPSDGEIIDNYSIKDIDDELIKDKFKNWLSMNLEYLRNGINHFNVGDSMEKRFFLDNLKKDNGLIFEFDKFNEQPIEFKRKFVNYCYNLDAFFLGRMPNVGWLYALKGATDIRKNEKINLERYFPQTILISDFAYLSYQKPYTILYALLIQYAYTFLNANNNDKDHILYPALLEFQIVELYFSSSWTLKDFAKYNFFTTLSGCPKLDKVESYQDLLSATFEQELKGSQEIIKNKGLAVWLVDKTSQQSFNRYYDGRSSITDEKGSVTEECKLDLIDVYGKPAAESIMKSHNEWQNKESLKTKKTSIKGDKDNSIFSTLSSWAGQGVSWVKARIKPILVTLGVVGSGAIAYKMWQTRLKAKVNVDKE